MVEVTRRDPGQAHLFLLNTVKKRIQAKKRNLESLYQLFLLVTPDLNLHDMYQEKVRTSSMKQLLQNLHPMNFPGSDEAAAMIYTDVQVFYEQCCKSKEHHPQQNYNKENITINGLINSESSIARLRLKGSFDSNTSSMASCAVQFHVQQKWTFLQDYCKPIPPTGQNLSSGKTLAPLIAYQCVNARGAIVHGNRPSLIYSWHNVIASNGLSVREVFAKHGGHKMVTDIDMIKHEIVQNGPVVSITFIPDELLARRYADCFVESRIRRRHYCIIVGWTRKENIDMWLIQSYHGNMIMCIPFKQYHIEDMVLIPKDKLEKTTWQKGPYFDRDLSKAENWLQSGSIEFLIKTKDMEKLAQVFDGMGLHEAMAKEVRFVLRDQNKPSNSRSCRLFELTWDRSVKQWRVLCLFLDDSI